MKSLILFNSVISNGKEKEEQPEILSSGFIIEPGAVWAKKEILKYISSEYLNGNDLNKTFHKSWGTVLGSTREELAIEQIKHYLSTYGSEFKDTMYIPSETLNIPDEVDLSFKVIKSVTKEDLISKCLDILSSGIALKEETLVTLLHFLIDDLKYAFTSVDSIKNKEALVRIAEMSGVYPTDPVEILRFAIYKSTGSTLLIKNVESYSLIKNSSFNPGRAFKSCGLERMAEIFNRFKPLFLSYKKQCPQVINKISKLSKTYHKPLVSNPLNEVTHTLLDSTSIHWLDNATPFSLFKALFSCYSRSNGQDTFVYRVRNGKSWVKNSKVDSISINTSNYRFLLDYIKGRLDLSNLRIYMPEGVEYALPTSEKLFVGNIPTGTIFSGEQLSAGVYWQNDWGANDLDISGINIGGKVGWNSDYVQGRSLIYSGDLTDAPEGAVEYLYAKDGLDSPTLMINNVYSGSPTCSYKIIVGKGSDVSRSYMMDPNNLFTEIKCNSVQKETVLGLFMPKNNKQSFILLNFGSGNSRVSGGGELPNLAIKALYQQWSKPLMLRDIIVELGGRVVTDIKESNLDLSIEKLEKDTFIKLFEENK